MSAIAALAGFNGKGTQGLVATETPTGDDRSAFWNEHDTNKTLLYGSTFTRCLQTTDTPSGGPKTWILDSGIDVLGDIGLEMEVYGGNSSRFFNYLCNIIDRVDFKVGSSIWQRLDGKSLIDILCSKGKAHSFSTGLSLVGSYVVKQDNSTKYIFPLQLLTKSLDMSTPLPSSVVTETGHFVCASPDQQVSVTIYFKDWKNLTEYIENFQQNVQETATKISDIKTSLYYKHYILSNVERQSLISNVIPKRLNSTQSRMFNDLTYSPNSTIVLDISEFSLYSSNLLLSLNNKDPVTITHNSSGQSITGQPLATTNDKPSYNTNILFDFELLLNNTSVFGVISSEALDVFGQDFSKRTDISTYDASTLNTTKSSVYLIPLSSCLNSASYVPLNRFDSIQIKLYLRNYGIDGETPSTAFGARVTCEGQVTALYDNGLANIRNV